jgi:predicted porin
LGSSRRDGIRLADAVRLGVLLQLQENLHMQKKLIALAIASLGLSGAAFADTAAVTIYGVADATFDSINVGDGKAAGATGPGGFQRVSTNSSLIGFKGAESIGNGLTAVFQYESGVGFDNLGSLGASRDSYVGVAGGFGTVAIGNLTGPSRALGASVDVNSGATGIGVNSGIIGKLNNVLTGRLDTTALGNGVVSQVAGAGTCARSATCTSAFDTRFTNAIAYISPNMGGVTVIVGYVPNENKGGTVAGSQPDSSAYDIGATYANGPIMVGVTTSEVNTKNSVETKPSLIRVAGSYDFGVAKVRALYDQTKVTYTGVEAKQTDYGVGVTVPMGGGTLLAQYYTAGKEKVNGSDQADTGASLLEVGYEYSLSKRTMLVANYTKIDNKNNSTYDFGVNSAGESTAATATAAATYGVTAGAAVSGFQIGVRHTF